MNDSATRPLTHQHMEDYLAGKITAEEYMERIRDMKGNPSRAFSSYKYVQQVSDYIAYCIEEGLACRVIPAMQEKDRQIERLVDLFAKTCTPGVPRLTQIKGVTLEEVKGELIRWSKEGACTQKTT